MAIVDSTRVITWTPGIPGGVPSRTTVFATVTDAPYSADNTGASDAYTAIQDAIDDCPDNQVVYIPAGTYRLNTDLSITKPIVLRGAGPASTFLRSHVSWHAIQIGDFPSSPVDTAVSGSPAKGATTLSVTSITTPALSTGDYIVIDQINDAVEVHNVDAESRDSGTRCLSQITKISSISGSGPYTLTIDPPLYHAYAAAQTPEVWELSQGGAMTINAGVENLTLTRIEPQNQDGYSNFKFVCAANCWLKNVESHDTIFWHVDLDRTFRCEIRDSFFSDGVYRTGGFAYGVVCGNRTTDALIENNRFYRCRHSMVVQGGPTGCVFGYNLSIDGDQGDGWLAGDLFPHGCHTTMNLFEGNCAAKAQSDWTHGSSSYNTWFRNFIRCLSDYSTAGQGRRVVDMDLHSIYGNYVGNVLGAQGITWTAEETDSTRSSSSTYIWSFGFNSDGDGTRDSTESATTVYRHGNYSAQSDSVTWDAGNADHDIPNSLYLSGKPSWFGTLPWPVYVSSSGASAAITDIPAGYRYVNGSDPVAAPTGSMAGTIKLSGTAKLT